MNAEGWLDVVTALGWGSVVWFWIPVFLWTVAAGATFTVLSRARRVHPLVAYRLRQALLLALPFGLLLSPWVPAFARAPSVLGVLPRGGTLTTLPSAMGSTAPALDPVGLLLALALLIVGMFATRNLVVLFGQLRRLRRLTTLADRVTDARALTILEELSVELRVRRAVTLLGAAGDSVPMTFNWTTPWIVIPQALCESPRRLRIVLAHELIHVRRGDAWWSLIERIVSVPFAFHPLVRLLERSIGYFREASCDAEVVGAGAVGPRTYAELLLEMSSSASLDQALAPGLFNRNSNLKQRLEIMRTFVNTPPSPRLQKWSVIASVVLFLGTVGLSACGRTASPAASAPAELVEQITSHFPQMQEQTRAGVLERLDVQMAYLTERLAELTDEISAAESGNRPANQMYQQYNLLTAMYAERLKTYETLKLERETDIRLTANRE